MKPYVASNEMLWKPDPNVQAARKLPEWAKFHRICAESNVFFDNPERRGRSYQVVAFTVRKENGLWRTYHLATGNGPTILKAIDDAYRKCGVKISGTEEMLNRGFSGIIQSDDFDDLISNDDFEELLHG